MRSFTQQAYLYLIFKRSFNNKLIDMENFTFYRLSIIILSRRMNINLTHVKLLELYK